MTVLSQSCDPKDFRTVLGTEDNTGTARASLLQFSSQGSEEVTEMFKARKRDLRLWHIWI